MKNLALILLVLLAGCVTNERTFSKLGTSVQPVGVPEIGTFDATTEQYIVSDLDERYHVSYFPVDEKTYQDIMGTAANVSEEVISSVTVHFNYPGVIDDEPFALNAFIGGHMYQVGTDFSVKRKDVMIDLFKFYFDLR
ncbi:MAG: hypothetical protein GOU98_00600 [Candidatus Altiarchaeota archaeon]|nr:hypothetical protein [Candidatus Altiarchaeota archaeon]